MTTTSAVEILAEIWEDVLEIDGVTEEDDFFELGGDSMLGVAMVSKARHAGITMTFQDLRTHPVLGGLVAAVAG